MMTFEQQLAELPRLERRAMIRLTPEFLLALIRGEVRIVAGLPEGQFEASRAGYDLETDTVSLIVAHNDEHLPMAAAGERLFCLGITTEKVKRG